MSGLRTDSRWIDLRRAYGSCEMQGSPCPWPEDEPDPPEMPDAGEKRYGCELSFGRTKELRCVSAGETSGGVECLELERRPSALVCMGCRVPSWLTEEPCCRERRIQASSVRWGVGPSRRTSDISGAGVKRPRLPGNVETVMEDRGELKALSQG
jgi:hypothetical protein